MSLGGKGREASPANLLSFSPRFGFKLQEAEGAVADMKACVGNWEEHYRSLAVSAGDIEAIRGCFALAMM